MVESHLQAGAQKFAAGKDDPAKLAYGQSITDACLGWDDSVRALEVLSGAVATRRRIHGAARRRPGAGLIFAIAAHGRLAGEREEAGVLGGLEEEATDAYPASAAASVDGRERHGSNRAMPERLDRRRVVAAVGAGAFAVLGAPALALARGLPAMTDGPFYPVDRLPRPLRSTGTPT